MKAEVISRLDELKEASPPEGAELFEPVYAAIGTYFSSDSTLAHDVQYTLHQLLGDVIGRATEYEHQELMPSYPTNFPAGYENVLDLFNGGAAFPEILTIDTEVFVDAFVEEPPEGGGDEGGEGEGTLKNPYLEAWAEQISGARSGELAGLSAICGFCDGGGFNAGLAMFFEDLGGTVKSPTVKDIAQRIYIDGGYYGLITEFGLPVHIPTIIENGVIL